jgi:hypothetical protein
VDHSVLCCTVEPHEATCETMQYYAMLQRNLLYTGVTRGKKLVVLVGQKKAVAIAVQRSFFHASSFWRK